MRLTLLIPFFVAVAPGAEPYFHQIDLWAQGEGGVHTYRIPALVETRAGTLIAIADARFDNSRDLPGRIALVMRRSKDRGASWTAPKMIRQPGEGGAGDASLLVDRRSGRVWCFHAYGPPGIGFPTSQPGTKTGATTLQFHAIYSDDDGETWSVPVDITPQVKDPVWHGLFPTSGTHIETSKGRYLVPMVVRDADRNVSAINAYSDDRGRTWRAGRSVGPGTDESHAVELKDGTILQNLRSNGKRRVVARSRDGGVTFDPPGDDEALVDPSCNAGITRLRRGGRDMLIFTNAASDKRENLTVRVSEDGGRTWPRSRVIHKGPAAYSTVIALRDGSIAVLYERGQSYAAERITFARFPPEWVAAVPGALAASSNK